MNTFKAITTRYSCRNFTDRQINDEDLKKIIASANAAPAASGDYSGLKMTIVQNKKLCDMIDEAAAEKFPVPIPHPTYGAPTLILISSKVNKGGEVICYANASCIAENIMIEANDLGINSLYMMGVATFIQSDSQLLKKINLSENHVPLVCVGLGYDRDDMDVVKEDRLAYEIIK